MCVGNAARVYEKEVISVVVSGLLRLWFYSLWSLFCFKKAIQRGDVSWLCLFDAKNKFVVLLTEIDRVPDFTIFSSVGETKENRHPYSHVYT